eukprot:TRINITY_DN70076_c0_g1_i1.p1 TRINITY_DN70076_c0_g1~~TRINITY_DN70076_c0_g1_i1.p1  ORF type:complete len:675 (+),score=160.62 TRINITY_DN70076_c0_g1_i1:189-2213(+)
MRSAGPSAAGSRRPNPNAAASGLSAGRLRLAAAAGATCVAVLGIVQLEGTARGPSQTGRRGVGGELVKADTEFIGFGAARGGDESQRRMRHAWALHYDAAANWLRAADRGVPWNATNGDASHVVTLVEVTLLESCVHRVGDTARQSAASALLATARRLLVDEKRSSGDTGASPDQQLPPCGGSCCPSGGCLFCSRLCGILPNGCSFESDARAVRSVWRLRAARASGRLSTRAIGAVGRDWEHCTLCGAAWALEFAVGQVDRARAAEIIPQEPNTGPGGAPLWYEGDADQELPGLVTVTGGVIAVLFTASDVMVWRLLRSLCTRLPVNHPLLLLFTSQAPPLHQRDAIALTAAGPGCTERQIWFVRVPRSLWRIDEADGEQSEKEAWGVSEPGGYRRMCWFWHRTIHWLPALREVKAVMRLDTDSEIVTMPPQDPIQSVLSRGAVYGYVSFCFDNTEFTIGLWQHFVAWRAAHLPRSAPGQDFEVPDPYNCSLPVWVPPNSTKAVDFCHVPMFYTNFEVLVSKFFRRDDVDMWLRSTSAGVRLRRWGDAPLRALTMALFARASDLVHLNEFSYRHGRGSGPPTLRLGNNLSAQWTPRKYPPHGNALDGYFLGICLRPPLSARKTPRPQQRVLRQGQPEEPGAPRGETRRPSYAAFEAHNRQLRSFMDRLRASGKG